MGGRAADAAISPPWRALLAPRRAMLGLAGVFVVSRGIGLIREIGVAYFFGTSVAADRWAAAFATVGVASFLVGEATYAAAVRWLGERRGSDAAERRAAFAELVRMGTRGAAVSVLVFAVAGPPLTLLVLGDLGENWQAPALLALVLAPCVGTSILASCFNAELTLERRFVLINGAQILYSAGAVAGLVVVQLAGTSVGTAPVAIGWSLGNLAALLVLYRRCPPPPAARASAVSFPAFVRIGLPVAVAYSLVAIQELTDRAVAARLGTGELAALSYSNRLFLLPIGFVIAALGPMVLGTLTSTRAAVPGDVARTALAQLRLMSRLLAPASIAFAAAAPLLVSLLFEYGAFTAESTELTRNALDGLVVGVAAVGTSLLLFRAMQAVGRLRNLVTVSLGAVAVNAALSIALAIALGLYGVTLATSLVALGTMTTQLVLLGRLFERGWAARAMAAAGGPVLGACVLCATLVTLDRAGLVSPAGRLVLGAAIAAGVALGLFGRELRDRRRPPIETSRSA